MRKILFSDLDGTMIGKGHQPLHPENLASLQRWREAGNLVALCTGRNNIDILPTLQAIPIPYDYLVLCNGAYIVDDKGQVIFEKDIPLEQAKKMLSQFILEDQLVTYFCDETCCCFKQRDQVQLINDQGQILQHLPAATFMERLEKAKKFTIVGINQEDEKTDFLDHYVKDILPAYEQDISWFYNTAYIDIMAKGSSKGNGMLQLANYLKIPLQAVYAIGDSYNDLSMIQAAGHSATFHRSEAAIKAQADDLVDYLFEFVNLYCAD